MDERYLSVREVSKILGVTPLTLRNWDKKRHLVAFRNPVNNYRMYRYSDIHSFIAQMQSSASREELPLEVIATSSLASTTSEPIIQKLTVQIEAE